MKTMNIKSHEIGNLFFGQLHIMHQQYFDKLNNCNHNRVQLRNLPHYLYFRDGQKGQRSEYYKYLKASWKYYHGENNTHQKRMEKIAAFENLYSQIKKHGIKVPIQVVVAPDGGRVIVDGNHRASIAYHLGIDINAEIIPIKNYLTKTVNNDKEFYGTKNKNMPYQSIFYGDELILNGRRKDIHSRFLKIKIDDIRGKSVADIGSNIAISGMLAWHYGAARVEGYEFSPQIASAALRVSTLVDAIIKMNVQDMGSKIPGKPNKFDTLFCFSLHAHVTNKEGLEKNILKLLKDSGVMYFEGHENSKKTDYDHIFKHFKSVKRIGFNEDGIHSKKSTRPFFRCVK